MNKEKLKEDITTAGGKVKSSLNSTIDILVTGDGKQSQLTESNIKRAREELGIEAITESELMKRISK